MRSRIVCGLGLGVALLLAGCSGGDDDDSGPTPGSGLTPAQLCSNVALDQCDRIYTCATAAQLRTLGFPASKLDCSSQALQQLGCTTATQGKICAGTATEAEAASCSSQVKAASCTDVATKMVASYASACGPCAVKP